MPPNDHEGRIRIVHSCNQQPCPMMEALQAYPYRVIIGTHAPDNPTVFAVLLVADDAYVPPQPFTDCVEAVTRLLKGTLEYGDSHKA